jgi:hypothetical protein
MSKMVQISEIAAADEGIYAPVFLSEEAWNHLVAWDDANETDRDEYGRLEMLLKMSRNAMDASQKEFDTLVEFNGEGQPFEKVVTVRVTTVENGAIHISVNPSLTM